MIQLSDIDGRTILLHPDAIAQVTEAGTSSPWHGIRAFIKTFDGRTLEVSETVTQILARMQAIDTNVN